MAEKNGAMMMQMAAACAIAFLVGLLLSKFVLWLIIYLNDYCYLWSPHLKQDDNKPQANLGIWFDDQLNTYHSGNPFKLF